MSPLARSAEITSAAISSANNAVSVSSAPRGGISISVRAAMSIPQTMAAQVWARTVNMPKKLGTTN